MARSNISNRMISIVDYSLITDLGGSVLTKIKPNKKLKYIKEYHPNSSILYPHI